MGDHKWKSTSSQESLQVKQIIKNTVNQYHSETTVTDNQLLWELVKAEIRGFTIMYSSQKKKEKRLHEFQITQKLEKLEKEYGENPSDTVHDQINDLKCQWVNVLRERTRGACLRAGLQ